ncbi:MAG: DNA-3-methyladenine glycosylase 2 family protein [Aeromicrobium sp.]|uniref:DNA-3-methyladenine glycosylase family protein n=1 Tax=Aeromicrobium sp. TaxID=1871063 RepID=UPI003C5F72D9
MEAYLARVVTWPSPVDLRRSLSPTRRGPGDPAFQLSGDDIWRTTRMATGPATLRLRQTDRLQVDVRAWGPGAREALDNFHATLPECTFEPPEGAHPAVSDAHRRFPGLRPVATGRVGEALIPAIIEQKVLGADAFAAWRRLLIRFGEPAPGPTPLPLRVVPTADQWAAIASWEWHLAGVDPQRYRTAQAAAHVLDRIEQVAAAGDRPATYRALRSIPGVGAWTAAEVGGRALGDPDAVPWGDYHLANLVGVGLTGDRVTHDEVPDLLEPYRPHRGHVVRLLQLSPLVHVERRGPRNSRVDHRRR